ncbi:MAG: hypothetical protein AABX35_03210 [Nanoarchaeota archaeon]
MKFKKDKYRKSRGNYSRLLNLYCRVCHKNIMSYQKDGAGNLRRVYLDRIFLPKILTNLQNKPLNKIRRLICSNCKEELGTPYIYKKENRKAYKIYQDSLIKKVGKLKN